MNNLLPIDFKMIIFNRLEDDTKNLAKVLYLQNKDKNLTFKYVRNAKTKDPLIQVNVLSYEGKKEVFDLRIAVLTPQYVGISVNHGDNVTVLKFQIFSNKLRDILLSYQNQPDQNAQNALWTKYKIK